MVIDAANGVEPQTRRLLQVCRARNTPILTFVNKDGPRGAGPLTLMDEIERELGMTVVPFTWPVGMGKVLRRRAGPAPRPDARVPPGEDRVGTATTRSSTAWTTRLLGQRSATRLEQAAGEIELVREAAPPSTRAEFLAAQTPMFFGSAINNFGVQEVLDALVELAPPLAPGRQPSSAR